MKKLIAILLILSSAFAFGQKKVYVNIPIPSTNKVDSVTVNVGGNSLTYWINGVAYVKILPTGMIYPATAGIATYNGTTWGTSITNNSPSWNTAFGWGDHAGLYPLLLGSYSNPSWITALAWSKITGAPSFLTSETDPIYFASSWFGTTNNSTSWNSAFTDRFKWDGGATGLVAATGRISLGLGTLATQNGTIGDYALTSSLSNYLLSSTAASTYQSIGSYALTSALASYLLKNDSIAVTGFTSRGRTQKTIDSMVIVNNARYQAVGTYLTAVPTLQQVSVVGNTTFNNIQIISNGSSGGRNVGVLSDVNASYARFHMSFGSNPQLQMTTNSGSNVLNVSHNNSVARDQFFANADGTIAMSVNGNTANSAGNITYAPAWTEITLKPTTIGGIGITDFNSLGDARWARINIDTNRAVNFNLHAAIAKAISDTFALNEQTVGYGLGKPANTLFIDSLIITSRAKSQNDSAVLAARITALGGGGGGSNWTVSGANIYRASGFVGIGTTNPADILHIKGTDGSIKFGGSNGRKIAVVNAANSALSFLDIEAVGTVFTSDLQLQNNKRLIINDALDSKSTIIRYDNDSLGLDFKMNDTSALFLFKNGGKAKFRSTVKIGAYTLPATDGTSNQALTTNGSGTVTWQTPAGGGIIDAVPTNGSTNAVSSDGVFDANALKANNSGATLTTATVNGVTLATGGSATVFLNQTGTYTTPAGGAASSPLTQIDEFSAISRKLGGGLIAQKPLSPVNVNTGNITFVDNQRVGVVIVIREDTTLTGVGFWLRTAFVGTADNENRVALCSYDGTTYTVIASSVDDAALWQNIGFKKKAFSAPVAVSAGVYYVVFLYNNSAQTTAPLLGGIDAFDSIAIGMDFSANQRMIWTTTGNNTLGTSWTAASTSARTAWPWYMVY